MPVSRRPSMFPAPLWLALVLPGCADGCNPQLQMPESKEAPSVPAANKSQVKAVKEATSVYGIGLPLRDGPLGALIPKGTPNRKFAHADLNKRFWLLLGPKGLVMNERPLAEPGPLPAGDVEAYVRSALIDWKNRSGVEAKGALVLLDQVVDPDTAKQVFREVRAAKSMEVTMLFRASTTTEDDAVEVAVPSEF